MCRVVSIKTYIRKIQAYGSESIQPVGPFQFDLLPGSFGFVTNLFDLNETDIFTSLKVHPNRSLALFKFLSVTPMSYPKFYSRLILLLAI